MREFAGHLALRAAARDSGRTALVEQAFRAPYHLSKPYWETDTGVLLVQVVNPTAGILAGDRLESIIAVDSLASVLVTAPSASRLFHMKDGRAECRQRFTVEAGGWLEVMPEPLVPHRGSDYRQTTRIDAAEGGELFFADLLVPGRVAHGETWAWSHLSLKTEVRIAGQLVLSERFAHSGPELRALAQLGGPGDAACFGNAILLTPAASDDDAWLRQLRELQDPKLRIGVSALPRGGWTIKFIAADAARLRQALREIRRIVSTRCPRLRCNPRKL